MYLDMQEKTKSGVLHQVTFLVNSQVTFTIMVTVIYVRSDKLGMCVGDIKCVYFQHNRLME